MSPHTNDFNRLDIFKNLIDQPMLEVDAPGISPLEVADQFFKGWRLAEGVFTQEFQQGFRFGSQPGVGELFSVLLGLFSVGKLPFHHFSFLESLETGVFKPLRMDSFMPGMDERYKLSWIARQSSSETRTALERLPVI